MGSQWGGNVWVLSMQLLQGPLILLHGFHPQLLQICSMHVINLGLMFDVNGCALKLRFSNQSFSSYLIGVNKVRHLRMHLHLIF